MRLILCALLFVFLFRTLMATCFVETKAHSCTQAFFKVIGFLLVLVINRVTHV